MLQIYKIQIEWYYGCIYTVAIQVVMLNIRSILVINCSPRYVVRNIRSNI